MNFQILIYDALFDVLGQPACSTKESTEDAGPNGLLVKRDSRNSVWHLSKISYFTTSPEWRRESPFQSCPQCRHRSWECSRWIGFPLGVAVLRSLSKKVYYRYFHGTRRVWFRRAFIRRWADDVDNDLSANPFHTAQKVPLKGAAKHMLLAVIPSDNYGSITSNKIDFTTSITA